MKHSAAIKFWNYKIILFFVGWFIVVQLYFSNPAEKFVQNGSYIFLGFFGAILGNLSAVGGGIVVIAISDGILFIFQYKLGKT